MNCPTCNVSLVMSDRQGIEIDYCPQCRGVWLDRGELDKIIEKSTNDSQANFPPPQQPYGNQNHQQYGNQQPYGNQHQQGYNKYNQKKKHWLNELFD